MWSVLNLGKTDYHRGKSVLGIFPVLGHHAIATILEPSLSPPLIFCQYFILFVISCNISQVTISGCMDITSINSVSTAICFTYINLVVKKVGPDPPYQSNIHPPHTYLTMLPFSAVTNSLQMLATNQVHTQSQTLMAKFSL